MELLEILGHNFELIKATVTSKSSHIHQFCFAAFPMKMNKLFLRKTRRNDTVLSLTLLITADVPNWLPICIYLLMREKMLVTEETQMLIR